MSVTREIIQYIAGARFERIQEEAVTRLKQFILDEIGNALGGSVLRSGKIIIEWGKQLGGAPESTIFSDGTKVPAGIASGGNTQLCMGGELMETYKNMCHPGSGLAIKLLGLTEEEAMNAFGMGLGQGPTMNVHNILYVPASMSKCGNQFHNFVAISAVLLAKLGYTGFYEILDDPYAYWTTISDRNDWETYTKGLGKDFFITTAISFKPCPRF